MMWLCSFLVLACTASVAEATPFKDWITDHGASDRALAEYEYNGDDCDEITVGPKHEPALRCYTQEDVTRAVPGVDEPAYRVLDHYLVRTVRDHAVVTLIDVPVRSEPLDGIPPPIGEPRKPWHPFEVAHDGMSIVVGDPDEASACRRRMARTNTSDPFERMWEQLDGDLHARICKARGRYAWRGGRFRRG